MSQGLVQCPTCTNEYIGSEPCAKNVIKALRRKDRAFEHALSLLDEAVRNMEHSIPPKGCYTANIIKRSKRFIKRQGWTIQG